MGNVCCEEPTNIGEVKMFPPTIVQYQIYKGPLELDSLVKERFTELSAKLISRIDQSKYEGVEKRQPYIESQHNFIYEGTWKDDTPEGVGKILFKNGEYFQGEFKEGKASGNGIYIFENGDYFEGAIDENKAQGHGTYTGSLIQFTGEWENSRPTIGTYTLKKDEATIHMKDKTSGNIKWMNGNIYQGQIKNQKPDGFGTIWLADKNQYEGSWKNGVCEGHGKFTWKNGQSYIGQYANGVKEGEGEFIYSDSKRYKGSWKNGKQNGRGKLFENDVVIYDGYFKDGVPCEEPEEVEYLGNELPQKLLFESQPVLRGNHEIDTHYLQKSS